MKLLVSRCRTNSFPVRNNLFSDAKHCIYQWKKCIKKLRNVYSCGCLCSYSSISLFSLLLILDVILKIEQIQELFQMLAIGLSYTRLWLNDSPYPSYISRRMHENGRMHASKSGRKLYNTCKWLLGLYHSHSWLMMN